MERLLWMRLIEFAIAEHNTEQILYISPDVSRRFALQCQFQCSNFLVYFDVLFKHISSHVILFLPVVLFKLLL